MISSTLLHPVTFQDTRGTTDSPTPAPFAPYQAMAHALRSLLASHNLPHYRLFILYDDVFDAARANTIAQIWPDTRRFDPDIPAAPHAFDVITESSDSSTGPQGLQHNHAGIWHIPSESAFVYRVHCLDKDLYKSTLTLAAAPDASRLVSFLTRLVNHAQSQRRIQRRWTVLRSGYATEDGSLIDSAPALDDLILSGSFVKTFRQQAASFFSDPIQALHARLNLPKSRKTILYGPPGTGKTTLCRAIARDIPGIASYHLTPNDDFDSSDMDRIYRKVLEDGPSLLLIEDIDTLVGGDSPRINTSNFLNLLDGANSPRSGPTLLLATTNHPDKLPESLINRPGRFMPIEVPLPDRALRLRYLQRGLPDQSQDFLAKAAAISQGLSFAHLQEAILLSGVIAMNDNRDTRSQADILAALKHINNIGESAKLGFPSSSNRPFGFTPRDPNTQPDTDTDAA